MARQATVKHVKKAGAFSTNELGAGEWGLDTTNNLWYYSVAGTAVTKLWATLPYMDHVALSDETTALTTGLKLTFHVQVPFTLISFPIDAATAPTGAALIVDVKKNGTTVYSAKPTIDATERTSVTGTLGTLSGATSFVVGDIITVLVDQIGSTIAGAGLKGTFIGTRD